MSEYRPRHMLITGGAGFIGSNYVHHALACDPELRIVNLDALTYAGSLSNLEGLPSPQRHIFVHGDIRDRPLIDALLRKHQIDTIVHFAAESHVDNSIASPGVFIETNVLGTFTLLESAREYWLRECAWNAKACRFYHISTDEVYGMLQAKDPPFHEATPYAPNSPYSASKAASDHLVRAYFHTYGLPMVMSNCSNNYGPRQHREKFIPTIIRCCRQQRPIPIYGNGSNIRDWLYVTDHCLAIDTVLRQSPVGETYNIGGASEQSNLQVCQRICQRMDELQPQHAPHSRLITFVKDRPGHDWRYAIDASKIHRQLGWEPQESFDSGIEKTLHWYLAKEV